MKPMLAPQLKRVTSPIIHTALIWLTCDNDWRKGILVVSCSGFSVLLGSRPVKSHNNPSAIEIPPKRNTTLCQPPNAGEKTGALNWVATIGPIDQDTINI